MLKLTLKPGDFIDIGSDIKVVFSGGSANNIHLLVDAPRELDISAQAQKEITNILMREKRKQSAGIR